MIQIYTGVPGAGKTYKMVLDLDTFLKSKPNITLICNINGLKLSHIDFDNFLLECFPESTFSLTDRVERFFTFDFQKSLNERFGGPIFYILDECQNYFPKRTSLPNTEGYLQRHRHLGHFLYLATQGSKLINANILPLIELEIYAIRRSISFFGEFHYRLKSPQATQVLNTVCHRPKKRIFELYKSFSEEEIVRPKKTLWKKLAIPLVFLIFGIYLFYSQFIAKKLEPFKDEPLTEIADSANISGSDTLINSFTGKLSIPFIATERVFLIAMRVHSSNEILVIDPDSNAVVNIKSFAFREPPIKVRCIDFGLTCYYDRAAGSGVVLATYPNFAGIDSDRPTGPVKFDNQNTSGAARSLVSAPVDETIGSGNFVDADLVPAPYSDWQFLK